MIINLTLEKDGKITLPDEIKKRYGFKSETIVKIVETSEGIFLIPLENEAVTNKLKEELED